MNCWKCNKPVKTPYKWYNYPIYNNQMNVINIQHEVDYKNNFKCKESN